MAGHFDEGPQRHPFQRYRMTTPKRVQVDAMAVIRGKHGQAGQSAFGRFRLMDDRQAAPTGEDSTRPPSRSHPDAEQRIQ